MDSQDMDEDQQSLELRRRAEASLLGKPFLGSPAEAGVPGNGAEGLLHELRVHQVELEMQNEELRRSQIEVEAARARYFDLFDLAPVGYCTVNPEGLILEANLTAAELLGMPRGALVAQSINRFIAKDDQDTYYLHRKTPLEPGAQRVCELVMLKADGKRFWAQLVDSVEVATGGVRVYRMTLNDVSERKRLDVERDRFQTAVEQAAESIVISDLMGNVQYVNPAFERVTGYSREEALDRNISFLKSGQHDPAFYRDIWETITAGQTWKGRIVNKRKDGSLFTEEASISPVLDSEENIINYVAVKREISERRMEA